MAAHCFSEVAEKPWPLQAFWPLQEFAEPLQALWPLQALPAMHLPAALAGVDTVDTTDAGQEQGRSGGGKRGTGLGIQLHDDLLDDC